jgi:hypothetical protein
MAGFFNIAVAGVSFLPLVILVGYLSWKTLLARTHRQNLITEMIRERFP